MALPLDGVGPVDPGAGDLDQQFARAGPGHRKAHRMQHFGPARRVEIDRRHHVRKHHRHHRLVLSPVGI
ncbi:MAG: hypothetical protein R3D83_08670 [Caenibius sp.]